MSKYHLVYTEIKEKKFNKRSTLTNFVHKKNGSVHQVLDLLERGSDGGLWKLNYRDWQGEE